MSHSDVRGDWLEELGSVDRSVEHGITMRVFLEQIGTFHTRVEHLSAVYDEFGRKG